MGLIFNIDDAPAVLASTNGLAVDEDVALRANDGKWDHVLLDRVRLSFGMAYRWQNYTHPNAFVELNFLLVGVVMVEGVQADVVVEEFGTNL